MFERIRTRASTKGDAKRRASTKWLSRAVVPLVVAVMSCGPGGDDQQGSDELPRIGTVAQALTDTDGDGMDDAWEIQYFGNLAQTASGDFDGDGMTNLEEYQNGFNPTVNDAF